MNKIGTHIQHFRKKEKLSQQELADKLCLTRQTISSWERGINEPDLESIQKLADIFHVKVEDLINGTEQEDLKRMLKKIYLGYLSGIILCVLYGILLIVYQMDGSAIIPVIIMSFLCGIIVVIFSYCVRNEDYTMLSGYEDAIAYDKYALANMLVWIQLSLVMFYVFMIVLTIVLDVMVDFHLMPFLAMIMFILYLFGTIIIANIKYRKQLYLQDQISNYQNRHCHL